MSQLHLLLLVVCLVVCYSGTRNNLGDHKRRLRRESGSPNYVCMRVARTPGYIGFSYGFGEFLCDTQVDGGGWIVIFKRFNGRENFQRSWGEYSVGFGNVANEFWFGHNKINLLTLYEHFYLRLDMGWKNQTYFAKYSSFRIASSKHNHTLTFYEYLGGTAGDSLSYHNNTPFSTYDHDVGKMEMGYSCFNYSQTPWWYYHCHQSNLFGLWQSTEYGKGVNWKSLTGYSSSLDFVEMKIRMDIDVQ